jgi:hypothetical protein
VNVALLEELLGLLKTVNETIGVPQGQSIEDKNVLQGNNPSDPNKRVASTLNSNERKRTTEIASLFAKTFFEYQKKKTPDKAIKTPTQKVIGKTGKTPDKAIKTPTQKVIGKTGKTPDKAIKTPTQKVIGKTGEKFQQKGDTKLFGLLKTLNETVGVLQGNNPSDPNKRVVSTLNSNERKRTTEIASLFAKTFFEYQKKKTPDKAIKTSIQKVTGKTGEKIQQGGDKVDKKSSWWKILLPLVIGIGALITGLMTDGPFKGALKILARLGLGIVQRQIKMILRLARGLMPDKLIGNLFEKLIPKNFIGNLIKRLLPIDDIIKVITGGMTGFINSLKGMIGAPFKALGGMVKGGGIMAKMLGFLKPLVSVLKKIPLLGSIISIGFAISRFSSGDNIGGVIDVLSALTGLIYLFPPAAPLAFALGLGLDMLNAFLDIKTGGATGKQQGAKMDLLGDMAKGIGKWIWKNALMIPVLGGFKRMAMSWDAFKSGDIMGGLHQFGLSLISFTGMGPLVTGIEMLLGFGEKKEKDKSLSPKTGWFSGLKTWIKKKLMKLPYVLRKPLEWFGILDDSKDDTTITTSIMGDKFKKLKILASSIWDGIANGLALVGNALVEGASMLYKKQVEHYQGLVEKDAATRVVESVKNPIGTIVGAGAEIVALGASRRDAVASEAAFLNKQKEMIKRGFLNPDGTPKSREERVKSGLAKPLAIQEKTVVSDAINTVKIPQKSQEKTVVSDAINTVKIPQKSQEKTVVSDAINTVKIPQKSQEKTVVSDAPNPNALPVVQSGNQQSLEFLHNIGMTQIKIMGDIKGIAAQILKKMDSSMGGSNTNTTINNKSSNIQKSFTIPMNSDRGDYGSSAYALG